VEYEWKAMEPDASEQTGTLHICSLGREERKGLRCRWVEVRKTVRKGPGLKYRSRKLLVAEEAFARNRVLRGNVIECWEQVKEGGPFTRLTGRRLQDFLGMGFEGSEARLRTVREKVEVETGLGKRSAKLVSANGRPGKRTLEYRGWLSEEVPFGWARFEIREARGRSSQQTIFTAVVKRTGRKLADRKVRRSER
jgi:hypothetical protein